MDMTGSQISHYQIEERLGEGGMGVVYRALDTKLGRKVALKFLPAFVSQKEEEKARFLHEARTTSGLDHPNIATIYEVNEADDKIFYAMQLVEGVTLKDLRRRGPVTNKQIIQLATQVADGLAHAHTRNVVHRDIKPQNIMVTREGRAIILDFGLALLVTQESISGETSTAGTAAYISPEQAQGDPATAQSDLFSLGVVLYELVAGQAPFLGDHPAALVYSIVHEDPPSLRERAPDAPPGLITIIDKLLAKDPAKRFQSASDLAGDLRQLARELEFSTYSGSVRTYRKEARFSWRSVTLAGAVVLALGLWMSYLLEGETGGISAGDQYDVAVMYFDDLTGDAGGGRTGQMVTELLITDLSSARYLRVLSSQRLYDILRQQDSREQEIDRSVATGVAREAGARNMITGTIAKSGDRTRLDAKLIDVATGEVVRAERVEGSDLFAMVDSLSARIRRHVSTPADLRADTGVELSIAEATTSNEEAYRQYIEGIDCYHRLDWDPALAHFDSAIALDSNFALAYLRAGIASFSSNRAVRGYQYVGFGEEALESGLLPPRESLLVAAFTRLTDGNDLRGGLELFGQLAERYPDDKEAHFWRGTLTWQTGNARDGIPMMLKALELDPTYPFALLNLSAAYKDIDDIPNAIVMAERYRTQRPDEAPPRLMLAGLYVRVNQLDRARAEIEEARTRQPDSYATMATLCDYYARAGHIDSIRPTVEPFLHDTVSVQHRTSAQSTWAQALFLDGRFDQSFAAFREAVRMEETEGDSLAVAGHLLAMARRYLTLGQTDSCRTAFKRAYRIGPDELKFVVLPYRLALREGDMDRAANVREKLLDRLAKNVSSELAERREIAYEAEEYLARGDFRNALDKLIRYRRLIGDPDDYSYWVGLAYLETGHSDSARHELQQSVSRYSPFNPNAYWLFSWYELGRTHEALGNQGDAAAAYRKFLSYWGRADRLVPEVNLARERLRDLAPAS